MFFTNVAPGEAELGEQRLVGLISRAALRTNAAEQSLAKHRFESRGNEEGFDAHVDQTRDRAGRVVGVKSTEDKMSGERCLHGNLRRLQVARLTDHDPVRVLPQKCAQDAGKRQADTVIDRDLDDPFQVILDRFLGGEQFGIDGVDLAQTRIKRGGFARTGRAGRNEDAVRPLDQFEQIIVDVIGHAELLEIEIDGRSIEHTQNQALTELGRQRGNAQVNVAAGDIFLDAAVLGQAAFGDVHVRHHFDAGNDGQREMTRRRRHLIKGAVDAITDFEFVLKRLEMDVARTVLDRLIKDKIDKANDRGRVCLCFHRSAIVFAQLQKFASLTELLEDVLHARRLGAVMLFDAFLDLLGWRDDDINVLAKSETKIFARAQIERINQSDANGIADQSNRQRAMQPRQAARDEP